MGKTSTNCIAICGVIFVKQRDQLNEHIRNYGCFFLCIIYIITRPYRSYTCDKKCYREIKDEWVLQIYKICVDAGYMSDDCMILQHTKVAEEIYKYFKIGDIYKVQQHKYVGMSNTIKGDGIIGKWKNGKYVHFVVMKNHNTRDVDVEYDPLYKDGDLSRTVRFGKLISWRIFSND